MDQSLGHFQLSTVFCFQVFVESQHIKVSGLVTAAFLCDTTPLAPLCLCLSGERHGVYVPRHASAGSLHTGRKHAPLLFSNGFLSSPPTVSDDGNRRARKRIVITLNGLSE